MEFKDPKMKVLFHIRPYFGAISPYIGLMVGTSNESFLSHGHCYMGITIDLDRLGLMLSEAQ